MNKMKDFANDLAHIVFAIVILRLTVLWWWGAIPSAFLIGLLIELKEENPNVLKWESWGNINMRDMLGYTVGGVMVSLIQILC